MDNLTPSQRRKNMSLIKSKNTDIELLIKKRLHKKNLKFKSNLSSLPGKPDIVFEKNRLVVFLDSCFWHQCPYHKNIPKTNKRYWIPKLAKNKERDKAVSKLLRKDGWKVIRFWEHQVKNNMDKCIELILYDL